ncbi:MAG: 23S rRNA (uracil(1939)-C(5))-methyltransferase RlmD, partial [Marinobacterium sp.]|nr:23S rRNA (uracil(1939)-C(5))-methyltransferase RlmD [Marinobacterium sp.]
MRQRQRPGSIRRSSSSNIRRVSKKSTGNKQRPAITEPLTVNIEGLSHEGRGIARIEGKTLFVRDALPGETVEVNVDKQHRRYDEGHMRALQTPSAQRSEPFCQHFRQCGGCQLQHLRHEHQIDYKQQWVLDQLQRQAQLSPEYIDSPLRSAPLHYRRAARIGINQRQDGSAIVGFRQAGSNRLTAIEHCPVLNQRSDNLFPALTELLNRYPGQIKRITHAELAFGDNSGTLTLRIMKNLDGGLQQRLANLAQQFNCGLYLDHGNRLETIIEDTLPAFELPQFNQTLRFAPGDFIQVNAQLNQQMIERALSWLQPQPDERILDLFCGLGNFTLPLASKAGEVVGVEGSPDMVVRGKHNAELNGLSNCQFEAADLTHSISAHRWFRQGFDKVLIDPPRTGALEVIEQLVQTPVKQLLYVSCNPSALARDAASLKTAGFRLQRFCVMDMFPHT